MMVFLEIKIDVFSCQNALHFICPTDWVGHFFFLFVFEYTTNMFIHASFLWKTIRAIDNERFVRNSGVSALLFLTIGSIESMSIIVSHLPDHRHHF